MSQLEVNTRRSCVGAAILGIQHRNMTIMRNKILIVSTFFLCCGGAAHAQTQTAESPSEPPFIAPARSTFSNADVTQDQQSEQSTQQPSAPIEKADDKKNKLTFGTYFLSNDRNYDINFRH